MAGESGGAGLEPLSRCKLAYCPVVVIRRARCGFCVPECAVRVDLISGGTPSHLTTGDIQLRHAWRARRQSRTLYINQYIFPPLVRILLVYTCFTLPRSRHETHLHMSI
jgi:hypothetical protein